MLGAEINEIRRELAAAKKEDRKRSGESFKDKLSTVARYGPLLAALLAPLSTLYDIPALSQKWFAQVGAGSVPDPRPSLILSAVSLTLNFIANALLVLRFSSNSTQWKMATVSSLFFWIVKTIIALVNIAVFGTRHSASPDITRTEGFWCAAISLMAAGIIDFLLIFHAIMHVHINTDSAGETSGDSARAKVHKHKEKVRRRAEESKDSVAIRVQGQQFMLSVIWLFSVVALEALVMSEIEHWSYFDGIYFSVVTMFTIGYGDLSPTHPASMTLLFFFAIVTIAGLANQIGIIVQFLSTRSVARKEAWQAIYEARKTSAQMNPTLRKTTDLEKEMRFLQELSRKEEMIAKAHDLIWSLSGFIVFWLVGAGIFSAIEGWGYGTAVYWTYVSLLTIGYGDFAPQSSAGRCAFVVYALMAVPIVATFAVQTVTSIMSSISERHLSRKRDAEGLEPSLKPAEKQIEAGEERETEEHFFVSHSEFVRRAHKNWEEEQHGKAHDNEKPAASVEDLSRAQEMDRLLTDRVLQLAVELEEQARTLILDHLDPGSKERMLLRADRNLQLRDLEFYKNQEGDGDKQISVKDAKTHLRQFAAGNGEGPQEEAPRVRASTSESTLEQIRRYRQTYASLLAAGSRLKGLQGEEAYMFERRRKPDGLPIDADGNELKG